MVAASVVVAVQPGVGFGLQLADGPEASAVERWSPAFLQGGALEPFAHGVVVRRPWRDAVVDQAEGAEVVPEPQGVVFGTVVAEHGPDRPAEATEVALHVGDEPACVLRGDGTQH